MLGQHLDGASRCVDIRRESCWRTWKDSIKENVVVETGSAGVYKDKEKRSRGGTQRID